MSSKLITVMLLATLVGCKTLKPQVDAPVTILPTYSDMVAIPIVQPTNLKPVQWQVLTRPELQKLLDDKTKPVVLYSLDDANMEALTGNLDDLNRYLLEQQAALKYTTGLINLRRETVTKDQSK